MPIFRLKQHRNYCDRLDSSAINSKQLRFTFKWYLFSGSLSTKQDKWSAGKFLTKLGSLTQNRAFGL